MKIKKKRNKTRIITGILVILIGISAMFTPWIRAEYFDYLKNKLIRKWYAAVLNNPSELPGSSELNRESPDEEEFGDVRTENTNAIFDVEYVYANMEGLLRIEQINFCSPILKGVTNKKLDIAVCVIDGSPEMGQIGNYCVAGHYSQIYGRHFNRLKEVRLGAMITVENAVEKYAYKVCDIFSVTAEDAWVTACEDDKKLITLITCDYKMEPIGRFIVKGELVESISQE